MVKNDICLGGVSKQNALFSKNVRQKTHPCPQCLEQAVERYFAAFFAFLEATLNVDWFLCDRNFGV